MAAAAEQAVPTQPAVPTPTTEPAAAAATAAGPPPTTPVRTSARVRSSPTGESSARRRQSFVLSPGNGESELEQANARIAEMTQQIVSLGQMVRETADHVKALETKNVEIERDLKTAKDALVASAQAPRQDKSELRSTKKLYPEKLYIKNGDFKDWSEEFLRWIRAEDAELEEYMREKQHTKDVLPMPGGARASDVKFVYGHLKKLMGDKESKKIVKNTPYDHGAEAWRRLVRKFNPQTQPIKSRRLRDVTNFGIRHASSDIKDVITVLADFEELILKYKDDYNQEEPLNESQKRDTLKIILPREIERAYNLNSLGRDAVEELSFDDLKDEIEEYIAEYDSYDVPKKRSNVASLEERVDTIEKQKGKGKGSPDSAFPGKGAKQPVGSCRICWKYGHFARDCPQNENR